MASASRAAERGRALGLQRRAGVVLPLRHAGREGLRQAVKLLNGEKVQKQITLPTMVVTKENAADILKQNGLI